MPSEQTGHRVVFRCYRVLSVLLLLPLALLGYAASKRPVPRVQTSHPREPIDSLAIETDTPLPSLTVPIRGARVPTDPSRLPGASRAYRGGQHEGVDFSCARGLPVHAAASGWVLIIDNEPDLPEPRREEALRDCRLLGMTPPEVLHVLHGRRIVLFHGLCAGQILTTSYSHLATIREDLEPGTAVKQGEVLGESGASGTSHAFLDDSWGEVHLEIHLNGRPLGIGLRPRDAGQLYRDLLTIGDHP